MDRRKSIKAIALGTFSSGVLLDACKNTDEKKVETKTAKESAAANADRMEEEILVNDKLLNGPKFFTDHEMATITILGDIIIPRDAVSGSASDAKVPEFIEFIVKDMPDNQTPMRGGLRWLDMQCLKRYEKSFKDCDLKTEDLYDVFENTKFYQKNDTLVFIKSKINDCEDLGKWNDNLVLEKTSIK